MTAPITPKKERAGVTRRREELASAERERSEYTRTKGGESANTGAVETRLNVAKAKGNLRRLLDALKKRGE